VTARLPAAVASRVAASCAPVIFAALLLAGCASPGPAGSRRSAAQENGRAALNRRVFDAAWGLVNRKYYDPDFGGVDWDAAARTHAEAATAAPAIEPLYAEINAMLDELGDAHTHALTPAQAREWRTEVRARTGMSLQRIDGRWVVTTVLPGSPAEAAGVRVGWIVVARNGVRIGDQPDFRAAVGEVADWEFLDSGGVSRRLSLTAQLLSVAPTREMRVLADGILYLRFDAFDMGEWFWVHRRLASNRRSPGLVIDLRQNVGGHRVALALMLGEVFPRRIDYGTFTRRSGRGSASHSWHLGFSRFTGPLAVLVGGGSASAAEIFAAAVKEHDRGVLVGRKTAGLVLSSIFYSLPDGGWLQLSVSDYHTSAGSRLEGNGVEPDIAAADTLDDLRAGRDPVLDAAVRALGGSARLTDVRPAGD